MQKNGKDLANCSHLQVNDLVSFKLIDTYDKKYGGTIKVAANIEIIKEGLPIVSEIITGMLKHQEVRSYSENQLRALIAEYAPRMLMYFS